MKYFLIIIFSFFCCNTFSQNVIKEYWENGNLKFERKYPRKDTIFIVNPETGKEKIKIFRGYDSLYFYTKEGKQVDYDEFTKLYGDNEGDTKEEKLAAVKKKRNDSIAEVKEIKRLDKLALLTNKKKIFLDSSSLKINFINNGHLDICLNSIPEYEIKYERGADYVSHLAAYELVNNTIVYHDIVRAWLSIYDKIKDDYLLVGITSGPLSIGVRSIFSKMDVDYRSRYVFSLQDIYLKDINNNYFRIKEYKFICTK